MPVTTQHASYTHRALDWQQCRDTADGSRAVKDRGESYLPKLTGQNADEYEAYKTRALWYGATGRTIQGLIGSVFRKPMQAKVPAPMEPHLKDITLTGTTLESFCKGLLCEILKVGRIGVLVDLGEETGDDAPAGLRPYWVAYPAERIRNWETTQLKGDTVLTMVVLYEDATEPDPLDKFKAKIIPQYRVLLLEEGKRYTVELYRESKTHQGVWEIHKVINPTFRGQPLAYIPFTFIGPNGLEPEPEKPPLQDLVEVNLSHYRSSADLEHGCHFTALPTPWVAGFPLETVLRIGSSIAWVTNDPNAKAGMLEFTGDGLGTLERALDRKERLMAVLGARMLEEQKKAVESAETHTIRSAGESSSLQSIAGTLEQALQRCLAWHAGWMGQATDSLVLELNKVFAEARMNPTELAELMKAWQAGGIAYETLFWNLQRGELTRPDTTVDDERRLIEQEAPARLPLDLEANPDEEEEEEEVEDEEPEPEGQPA